MGEEIDTKLYSRRQLQKTGRHKTFFNASSVFNVSKSVYKRVCSEIGQLNIAIWANAIDTRPGVDCFPPPEDVNPQLQCYLP